jgi:hypothetical protein
VAEYDIKLASKFAQVANNTVAQGLSDPESHRVVAYLSRLSMEISLKAFLESAGFSIPHIRRHSHRLKDLLAEIDRCDIEVEISVDRKKWCSASRLRSIDIPFPGYQIVAGNVIEAEDHGASTYPSELRYGNHPKDFPAEALASAASTIANWVDSHAPSARRRDDT